MECDERSHKLLWADLTTHVMNKQTADCSVLSGLSKVFFFYCMDQVLLRGHSLVHTEKCTFQADH